MTTDAERDAHFADWLAKERLTQNPILVHITDQTTGEMRIYKADGLWGREGAFQDFIWSDGNYACDCNRGGFFLWAGGEPSDSGRICGMERYRVRITDKTGSVIYEDGQADES